MIKGHRRPAGTTTRIRLYYAETEPELGSLVFDSPLERERGYRIVGVEEVARPGRWNLVLERLDWRGWQNAVYERLNAGREPIAFGIVPHDVHKT